MHDTIFAALVDAVESEGGELLMETHHPEILHYTTPGGKPIPIEGTGCGQDTLLRIPYDDHHPAKDGAEGTDVERRSVKVCAIDDSMHLWPRYAGAVYGEGA